MKHLLFTFILTYIFATSGGGQILEKKTEFEWGPRPPTAVFDPDGLIDATFAAEISMGLAEVLKNEVIDIIVVVLKDIDNAPPEYIAKMFATAWARSPFNCVVLYVPGRTDNPWLFAAKKVTEFHDLKDVEIILSDVRQRILEKSGETERLKTATQEAVELMRYWINTVVITSNTLRQQQETINYYKKRREERIWYLILFSVAFFIPSIAAVWLLVRQLKRLRPAYFPQYKTQTRLGAPYSGGNRIIVDLRKISS
jgi:hypothetical protein